MIIHINKTIGETPNDLIERFRRENPDFINEKISFAGRLDPMASGAMILLTGNDCKSQPHFISLKKTYRFKCIMGITTDTYDILGIPNLVPVSLIKSTFNLKPQKFSQEFPIYSSRVVNGHPLWWWAKQNRINEIVIPNKECEIYSVINMGLKIVHSELLLNDIITRILKLPKERFKGFRVEEIVSSWKKMLENIEKLFVIGEYEISVSSGTYIRGICNSLGGTAMDIHRVSFD